MTNPITQQIRDARHRLAAKFDNDLDRIVDDLQRQQSESGRHYVDRSKQATNHAMQRSGGGDVADSGESTSVAG
ncbi:hypothetical protein [Novipirellula artificiosorum]|uniref:Uncharacterized protein n=1 Tax=Novipirellula artificiosorum TaxID=2528016 RepID=A0A5C6DMR0_9BACT|nr:hypothetical protein [Novipirellula artificiosorum]TWU37445.1 hypothetical protein Poly41_35770 [Novipirellula artificiosorum]